MEKKKVLVSFETDELVDTFRPSTQPILQTGGPGSGLPTPYLVATGQTGHAVVGIDIGTRYSRIATYEESSFQDLTAAPIPSIACRLPNGNLTVGMPPSSDVLAVIRDFRGLIGTDWYIEAECGFFSADMLTELLIKKLAIMGQGTLGRPISKAVLTTPATYNSNQRKLLRLAAETAGIDVLQLINEPTAAAIAHCHSDREFQGTMLLYHLGAGTFATSIMAIHNGLLEVRSTIGDDTLTGNAFIARLINWMIERFDEESGYKLDKSAANMFRLMTAAAKAIEDLHFTGQQANIRVTNLETFKDRVPGASSKTHGYLLTSITMNEYLKLIEPILLKTLAVVDKTIEESGITGSKIDRIVVSGDFRSLVPHFSKVYERCPSATILPGIASSAVHGAALQAALLTHNVKDLVVWDIVTEPVWVEQSGELKQVIARGTPLPITAYHKCESPDSTVNLHVVQGNQDHFPAASLAELTISNCPPTTAGETKVEVQLLATADGIIDYKARHIGLEAQLPLNILDGQPVETYQGWSETKHTQCFDTERLNRLARILNMQPLTVLNLLRSRGYSVDHIKNGRAIEDMLHKLKQQRRERDDNES
ncbi:MAG: Hsp70 family protein [Candidatus Obscuribacterales bacterium]|nr:Hsp70 family protein [Candidatus Obscuribacterales bacterium]